MHTWYSQMVSNTIKRQRLYTAGTQTPFFIDSGHTGGGSKYALYASGFSEKGFAKEIGRGDTIKPLKEKAQQLAEQMASEGEGE